MTRPSDPRVGGGAGAPPPRETPDLPLVRFYKHNKYTNTDIGWSVRNAPKYLPRQNETLIHQDTPCVVSEVIHKYDKHFQFEYVEIYLEEI